MRSFEYVLAATFSGLSLAANVRIVQQFPNPTWVENVASTRNGSVLAGVLGQAPAQLHIIDPSSNATQNTLLHTFAYSNSIFGITEYETDVFAVAAGNFSSVTANGTGDANIWSVDLRRGTTKDSVKVRKLAYLKDAQINGFAALNSDTLLFTDSWAGNIRKVDVRTGKYEVVLQDASTANNLSTPLPLGANGLKVFRPNPVPSGNASPTLYFSNLQLGSLHKVSVDQHTGRPRGDVVTLAKNLGVIDDLAITDDGTVFLARDAANDIVRISNDKEVVTLGGEYTKVLGPTAAVVGRTYMDRGVLYVSAMGGQQADGTFLEGGKVVAVDLTA
ncbi:hypothetical protein SLS60_004939 [Paraconiothyrium brasiliense]|uniref:SMP-30/Gluconolactonase/LRE-like region domain-containing protein n=1 Tax=Paraconiothyrium brasiliense TaxID=300254 RepID=A0ABR3RLS8_9PLEO